MDSAPIRSTRPLRALGIAAAIATIPAVLASHALISRGASLRTALLTEAIPWYGWALMTPVILMLARRFPVDRAPRAKAFGLHVLFGLAAGLAEGCFSAGLASFADVPVQHMGTGWTTKSLIMIWLVLGLIMYAAIASIGFALDYHARMLDRERAADRLEHLLVESRLGALRMQLQPHFLYNALNTISMLVRQGEGEMAVRVIARFGELLRHVLDDTRPHVVSLDEELDLVARYLEIEQVRFNDRLRVHIAADETARATPVPYLLLQPIVENAVRHGISRRAEATHIRIAAECSNGTLRVTVQDDGPGPPAGWGPDVARGIGLRNTRDRLNYLYGPAASLDLRAAEGGGAVATVVVPSTRSNGL